MRGLCSKVFGLEAHRNDLSQRSNHDKPRRVFKGGVFNLSITLSTFLLETSTKEGERIKGVFF
jgi:hypothetical protein